MAKTYLVTGAAGFIGSTTAEHLIRRGDRVIGLDNLCSYYSVDQKRKNLEELRALRGDFENIEGDLRDTGLLTRIFEGRHFDAVIHLGAMAGVRASVSDPALYYDVNLKGTLHLLDLAVRHGRPRFVLASTSSAYGSTERVPFVETDAADRPLAPYPASKRAAELLCHSYHHLYSLNVACLRFFTVYGPRGRPDMLAYLVLDSIRTGAPLTLYRRGELYRDWTYVDDIVSGVVAAADRPLGYEIINLGRGEPVLVRDFVDTLEKLSKRRGHFQDGPLNAADVERTSANIDKARRLLDFAPQTSVAEGAARFYDWYQRRIGRP